MPPLTPRHTFFAVCASGLEPVLHSEARALELSKVERQVGGVRFEGRIEDAWRANLWMRTAGRVLLRLERFTARDDQELYQRAREVDWSRWLTPSSTLSVRAQTRDSAIAHSRFLEQRLKDAVVDQFRERTGARPSVDREHPDVVLHVHLSGDRCTLSIDTSGESLHKRGWRQHQGRAPLAETLAAGVVALSKWDLRSPLVDPFCGSGTIVIEAALAAGNVAPGLFRERFAFESFPGHDRERWHALREDVRSRAAFSPRLRLLALEGDEATLRAAQDNAEAAGVAERITFERAGAESYEYKRGWGAWIVTNPPYGERIGREGALLNLYRRFGARLRERCAGWQATLLSGNPRLLDALGLEPVERLQLFNGSLPCDLARFELPAS